MMWREDIIPVTLNFHNTYTSKETKTYTHNIHTISNDLQAVLLSGTDKHHILWCWLIVNALMEFCSSAHIWWLTWVMLGWLHVFMTGHSERGIPSLCWFWSWCWQKYLFFINTVHTNNSHSWKCDSGAMWRSRLACTHLHYQLLGWICMWNIQAYFLKI